MLTIGHLRSPEPWDALSAQPFARPPSTATRLMSSLCRSSRGRDCRPREPAQVKPRPQDAPVHTVDVMTDMHDAEYDDQAPDGSTEVTDKQQAHTEDLADGSPSGDATTDPEQSSDTTSGGSPEGS
jgi:hypothetical protein